MRFFRDEEENKKTKEEEVNRSKVTEVNQLFDDIAENPEKLTLELALEIYDKYYFKRDQITSIFFNKIKFLSPWVQIYKTSKDTDDIKPYALESIKKITTSSEEWIALYESEKDEELQKIAVNKVGQNSNSLDDWIEVYKLSSYGTEISKNAVINMRKYAKTHEDWRRIYEITPFDSKARNYALERLMMTAHPKTETEEQDTHSEEGAIFKSDWSKEYENINDFYAQHKDLALINRYILANSTK